VSLKENAMSNQPSAGGGTKLVPPTEATLDPDHEYQDSTESKLDHTRPPHHDSPVKNVPHRDTPQTSIGNA